MGRSGHLKDHATSGLVATAKAVTAAVALVLLVPFVRLHIAYSAKYRDCVALANGLYLGYEAVFDLRRPYFKPIAVPKFPDGTPLIRDVAWAIYVTNTTIYGRAMGPTGGADYQFAWRADIGLVRQQDDQATYERLIAEAGHANWDIEIDSDGTGWLLNELIRQQRPVSQHCLTSLLTW